METWLKIVLLTLMAGMAIPAGALLARWEKLSPQWLEQEFRHFVIAFGGGALLSAVALVLVPEGIRDLDPFTAAACFMGGGVVFFGVERWLSRTRSAMGQTVAMLTDFVPEAMALGSAFALGTGSGALLAVLMALQNLPEGFNAYREMVDGGRGRPRRLLMVFAAMGLLGPLCGLVGYYVLSGFPVLVSGIMVFAGGGILYVVFGDLAPQARLKKHWLPPLGAVAGFMLGLVGHMLMR